MTVKVQTSLRIDQTSLQDAKKILEEMGMNFSEAVNIFTKMIVSHNEKNKPKHPMPLWFKTEI